WWALVTLTTVGYGDVVPITAGGRIFAGLVIVVGLGVVAMPTALITAALMDKRREEKERAERTRERHAEHVRHRRH
ncbi:MAG: potassium channel family protein, partial [Pseudomonadota bacterium]